MAQYIEKWDGGNVGDPPPDWSAVLGTSNITLKVVERDQLFGLNRALEIDSSTSDLRIFKWDTPDNSADVDILLIVEFPHLLPGDSVEIWLRGGGTDASTLRGYVLRVEVVDALRRRVTLYRQQGATRTGLHVGTFLMSTMAQRSYLRFSIRDSTLFWDHSRDSTSFFWLSDEEWWDSARRVTDTAITGPGWVGIGSNSTGIKIVRPIGLGTGQDEAPLPLGPPPEHEEPAQFRFDFKNDAPGQPPEGWEIVGWDHDKDDEPEVIVTNEGTVKLSSKDAWAELLSLHPDLQDVYDLDIAFRWRFVGEFADIYASFGEAFGGMWTQKNYGANLYVYGSSAGWDDWDYENGEPTRPPLDPNTWYFTRLRFVGDELAAVHWQADDPPPEEWDGQVQDIAKPYFSAQVGFGFNFYDESAPATIEIDYVGVGIGGAPAPIPEGPGEPTELGGRSSTGTLAAASLDTQLSLSGRSASGARGEADVDTGVRLAGRSGTVTRAAAEVNSAIRLAGRSPTATRVDASVASRASFSGQSATPTRAQGAVRTGVILSGRSAAAPRAHAALDATVEFGGRSATATRARGDLRVPDATRLSGRSATVTRAAGRLVVDMVPPIVEEGIAVITRHHAVGTAMVRRQEALASITRVQEREARI